MQKINGIKRLLYAFKYSTNGLFAALRHEAAFRQEFVSFSVLAILSLWLPVTPVEHVLLLSVLLLVLITELLNSGLECLADSISLDWHPLIARAKDYGSLAVLLSLFIAIASWLAVLLPKLNF